MKNNPKTQYYSWRHKELLKQPKAQVLMLTEDELSKVAGGRGKAFQMIMAE